MDALEMVDNEIRRMDQGWPPPLSAAYAATLSVVRAEIARLTRERDIWKSENDRILLIRAQMEARIAELEEAILVRDRAIKVANDSVERVDLILASWHKVFPVDDPVIARRMVEDRAHAEQNAEIARLTRERDEASKRSEYWKAEHLAGNEEIARLQREREQLIDERCELKAALNHWITEYGAEKERRQAAERERDEAVRVAVWAALNDVVVNDERSLIFHGSLYEDRKISQVNGGYPGGTDADIYRALREAMGGEGESK